MKASIRTTTLSAVEAAWLFTRGEQSVRIVRTVDVGGHIRLLVQGPGSAESVHLVNDGIQGALFQAELERRLVSQGFSLQHFATERRSGTERRVSSRGRDRRR